MSIPTTTATGGARIVGASGTSSGGPGPFVIAASTLEGDRVYSSDNEEVGKIKEIMIDVQQGRIVYAVMSSGGFLGIGDKLLALPWVALALDVERKCFVLNVTGERVKQAPGFDKDHWPAMADIGWATTLHDYYGVRPHWQDDPADPPEAGGVKL
ncbi:PRC-barrel domain containing protein [Paraburkholderia sp. Ac-20340]|uniref:PRC-barrel domain-containing protein n=1 Tax=Paraburkholderia sp. Ac-20340 TaxID=2703888 RepID=UPI00197EE90F|nr:PRC-barrel domain-containing protein [Paraburkholderia sp. Ac-20340]MBN3851763.1 PRC-barrel domain containing protein [Paraburkholderia sp. Ac-20340]